MQSTAQVLQKEEVVQSRQPFKLDSPDYQFPKMVYGMQQKFIKWLMWNNILVGALKKFRNPFTAIQKIKQLKKLRNQYRNQHPPVKYSLSCNKYLVNYNTHGR